MHFANRTEAGQLLAAALAPYRGDDVVIYALPRGGVVLGAEVARAMQAPLDLVIARKIGHPYNAEYAIGAVSEGGYEVFNEEERANVDPAWFRRAEADTRAEAQRRRAQYLHGRARRSAAGKTAILIDDGIATGLTMFAAIAEMQAMQPRRLIVAVPVIPRETADKLAPLVDAVVALEIPTVFLGAVGAYYTDFPQVSDAEVIALLAPTTDPLHLFAFPNYQVVAEQLLALPTAQLAPFSAARFPNGELQISVPAAVRQQPCLVIGSIAPPDAQLLELLLLCDTLAHEGAAQIQAVLPYLAYMRQDKPEMGKSLTARWLGALLRASGVHEVLTVDIHSQEGIADFVLPLTSLSPASLFAGVIDSNDWRDATLIAPDEGAIARRDAVRQLTGDTQPTAHFRKARRADAVHVELHGTVGTRAVLIDDMLDTGATLVACCEALQRLRVADIVVMVTHGLFTGTHWQRLWALGVRQIYCTDTLPLPAELAPLPITVLSVHPLLKEFLLGNSYS